MSMDYKQLLQNTNFKINIWKLLQSYIKLILDYIDLS